MGISDCPCGGHIPLGPEAANCCDKCGMPVLGWPCGEDSPDYWRGNDDGIAGAGMRWEQALTKPIPNAGVMREPMESLYRRTEALRTQLQESEKERDQWKRRCDGGWTHPNDVISQVNATAVLMARYEAALELIAAPKRADGTYNRCREACEVLAREALGR